MSPRKPKQEIEKQAVSVPFTKEDLEDTQMAEKADEMLKELAGKENVTVSPAVTRMTAEEYLQVEGIHAVYEMFDPVDEQAERSAIATAMAIEASRMHQPGKYTFYVLEHSAGCRDINYIRAGKNGIKGASTWSKNRCPTCEAKWDLGTVKVIYQVGGE